MKVERYLTCATESNPGCSSQDLNMGVRGECVRVHLHQASASTLQQLCDDASNTALIENNGIAPE